MVGLGLRPVVGISEAGSKLLQGVGLACQGKRGIQGKLIRRVMAPGAPMQNAVALSAGRAAIGADFSQALHTQAMHAQLLEAWQRSLPFIAPALAADKVRRGDGRGR